jgi:hypothetical protein
MIFWIFSPNKMAFLAQNKAKLSKNLIITRGFQEKRHFFAEKIAGNCDQDIGFQEKRQFFRQKLPKIAENCVRNIDHRIILHICM